MASTWWPRQKKLFEEEGVKTPDFVVPGGGAKVVQALAAGQVLFALGDSNHPLKITEKGKDALMVFATDTRCSYANIVVRKELWDKGVKTVEALADQKLVGRKAVVAATAIGSGTYVYGVYVLQNLKGGDGKPVNDHVEWVGGGASTTMLGGLKAGKFDAIMAVPEWQAAAVEEGFGKPLYDIQDEKAWNRVFGGPIPVTVGYVLKETIEKSPDLVQAYVNACYRAQQWIRRAKDDEIDRPALEAVHGHLQARGGAGVGPLLPDDLRLGLHHRREGLRPRHEGVGAHRGGQADPVQAGGGHELRQEGAGEVQVKRAGSARRAFASPSGTSRRPSARALARSPPSRRSPLTSTRASSWPSWARPAAASPPS